MSPSPSPWWSPHVHADRRGLLKARAKTFTAWRNWFDDKDFLEVDTAALQVSPGNEAHIAAFASDLERPDGGTRRLYLHTSPEFACKKLLAAGETRIFSLGHVFRNGERGPLHHPEFTMLEWYRAAAPYRDLIDDVAALCALAADAAGARRLTFRGRSADPFAAPERLGVCEAFERHAGVDLSRTLSAAGEGDREALAPQARAIGLRVTADDDWGDLFSKILAERVEPKLGDGRLTVLDAYPACEAALARRAADDPRLSERFEVYACGVELANAFGELTDAAEQRRRFEAEMDAMQAIYGRRYPIDDDFLEALAVMPPASGVAMGADRVLMLATGAETIDRVIWTPVAE